MNFSYDIQITTESSSYIFSWAFSKLPLSLALNSLSLFLSLFFSLSHTLFLSLSLSLSLSLTVFLGPSFYVSRGPLNTLSRSRLAAFSKLPLYLSRFSLSLFLSVCLSFLLFLSVFSSKLPLYLSHFSLSLFLHLSFSFCLSIFLSFSFSNIFYKRPTICPLIKFKNVQNIFEMFSEIIFKI